MTPLRQLLLAVALAMLIAAAFDRVSQREERARAAEMAQAQRQAAQWLAAQPIREAQK